jgi:hypothetical protein
MKYRISLSAIESFLPAPLWPMWGIFAAPIRRRLVLVLDDGREMRAVPIQVRRGLGNGAGAIFLRLVSRPGGGEGADVKIKTWPKFKIENASRGAEPFSLAVVGRGSTTYLWIGGDAAYGQFVGTIGGKGKKELRRLVAAISKAINKEEATNAR